MWEQHTACQSCTLTNCCEPQMKVPPHCSRPLLSPHTTSTTCARVLSILSGRLLPLHGRNVNQHGGAESRQRWHTEGAGVCCEQCPRCISTGHNCQHKPAPYSSIDAWTGTESCQYVLQQCVDVCTLLTCGMASTVLLANHCDDVAGALAQATKVCTHRHCCCT